MDNQAALPWYRSPVQISQVTTAVSALVAIFPKVGQALGLTSPGAISTAVTIGFSVITVLAPVFGSIMRARSKIQPLTLTQAGADVHPNTLASAAPSPAHTPHRGLL